MAGRKKRSIETSVINSNTVFNLLSKLCDRGQKNIKKIKAVCIYLKKGYKSIARRCFLNAKIKADKFHAIRLVLYHFMEFCKDTQ